MRTTLKCAAVAVPLILILAACDGTSGGGSDDGAEGTQKITVATAPIGDYTAVRLSVEEGFFEEEGLEVEFVPGRVGTETITGVLSGSTDFAGVAVPPLLVSQSRNLDVAIVAPASVAPGDTGESTSALLALDPEITTPADLEGKTIAVNALKAQAELEVRLFLDSEDVATDSVTFVEVPFGEMPAALERGDVDAITGVEPFLSAAIADGATVIGEVDRALPAGSPITAYFTSDALAASDPELVEKFSAAITKSLEYAAEHPDDVRAMITEFTEVPAEVTAEIALPTFSSTLQKEGVEQVKLDMEKYGFLSADFEVDDLFWSAP